MRKIIFTSCFILIAKFSFALPSKLYEQLTLFTKIIYLLEGDYVDTIDEEKLVQGAIVGMLNALDPHTMYLKPEHFKELQADTSGKFGGIGIEISLQNGMLTVVSPMEDTPADRAGLKPGDKIIKIDGKSTKNMALNESVKLMRGALGSKVVLTILHENSKEFKDITIKREIIRVQSVKAELLEQSYAWIRIASFQSDTIIELKKTMQSLQKKSGGLKGIILDLRNNPGGLLEQAVQVSDLFLTDGVIVSTKGRTQPEDIRKAHADGDEPKCPIVILINRGSASASEIVSGALLDQKRATLIGERSFGKGSVQTVVDLEKFGGLKMTIAKYYTPSGKSIHGVGIKPDYLVKNPKEEPAKTETQKQQKVDFQKDAALEFLKTHKISAKYLSKETDEDKKSLESQL